MASNRVGYAFFHRDARHGVEVIARAEEKGVPSAWLVMPSLARDSLSVLTAAALQTSAITLGTAIVPAFTRHPVAMATQVMAIEDFAPGRLRLGIGTSHQGSMNAPYGEKLEKPLSQLREYLEILKSLFATGQVDFAGDFYSSKASIAFATQTPVLISALRAGAWELAGELSDGAISWNCPPQFLATTARTALDRGAKAAGRPSPPMIAHAMVTFDENRADFLATGRDALKRYAGAPFYARMFADAGYPVIDGEVSDDLIDAFVIHGSDDEIAAALLARLESADELLVNLTSSSPEAEDRIFEVIGRVNAQS